MNNLTAKDYLEQIAKTKVIDCETGDLRKQRIALIFPVGIQSIYEALNELEKLRNENKRLKDKCCEQFIIIQSNKEECGACSKNKEILEIKAEAFDELIPFLEFKSTNDNWELTISYYYYNSFPATKKALRLCKNLGAK